MRITKVYTRVGDQGMTALVGGQQVAKHHPRVVAYGAVDELNAVVGLVRAFNGRGQGPIADAASQRVDVILSRVQNQLFNLGATLATLPADRWQGMERITEGDVGHLEQEMDSLNEDLPPLEEFILPGGGEVGAFLHQARTVCRRLEQQMVALRSVEGEPDAVIFQYVNRLSDLFFVLARWAARMRGEPETFWQRGVS